MTMTNTQLTIAARNSVKHLLATAPDGSPHAPADDYGMPKMLSRMGNETYCEWEDTMYDFAPSVLQEYPDITPYIDANGRPADSYGVGYGSLVACNWNGERYRQVAVWEDDSWSET